MTDASLGRIRQNDRLKDARHRLVADPIETCFIAGTDNRSVDTREVDATIDGAAIAVVAFRGAPAADTRSRTSLCAGNIVL
ncbi:MAG: hypothetical protein IH895_00740 [Planctomycetes bacterium]|nr:hypothetical protein [Planctomycetota bacterium]